LNFGCKKECTSRTFRIRHNVDVRLGCIKETVVCEGM